MRTAAPAATHRGDTRHRLAALARREGAVESSDSGDPVVRRTETEVAAVAAISRTPRGANQLITQRYEREMLPGDTGSWRAPVRLWWLEHCERLASRHPSSRRRRLR
jgi:hypothetical protein